jgi:hypothetical protein
MATRSEATRSVEEMSGLVRYYWFVSLSYAYYPPNVLHSMDFLQRLLVRYDRAKSIHCRKLKSASSQHVSPIRQSTTVPLNHFF